MKKEENRLLVLMVVYMLSAKQQVMFFIIVNEELDRYRISWSRQNNTPPRIIGHDDVWSPKDCRVFPRKKTADIERYGAGSRGSLARKFTVAGQFTCVVPPRHLQWKDCSFQSFDDDMQGSKWSNVGMQGRKWENISCFCGQYGGLSGCVSGAAETLIIYSQMARASGHLLWRHQLPFPNKVNRNRTPRPLSNLYRQGIVLTLLLWCWFFKASFLFLGRRLSSGPDILVWL